MPLSKTGLLKKLDPSEFDANTGDMFFGSGNLPVDFQTQVNHDYQVATSIKFHYRTSLTTLSQAVGDDGTIFNFGTVGAQVVDAAHGVSSANANRAAQNWDYSFTVGADGGTETLQDFLSNGGSMVLQFDLDPTKGVKFETLHAVYDVVHNPGGSHIVWEDAMKHIIISDDGGNALTTQNSENYAFYASMIDTNPHLAGIQPYTLGPADFKLNEVITYNGEAIVNMKSDLLIGVDPSVPVTKLHATLDANETDGHGNQLTGSGNSASDFTIRDNNQFHEEIGIRDHYRTSNTTFDQSVGADGVVVNHGKAGAQVVDIADGVFSARADRQASSFDFAFSTGHNGGTETLEHYLSKANGGHMYLDIDLNPGAGTSYLHLHAVFDALLNPNGSHIAWEDNKNHVVIGDDGGNLTSTENSQNMAFFSPLIDTNPHLAGIQPDTHFVAGDYSIIETMTAHGHTTQLHSDFLLVA